MTMTPSAVASIARWLSFWEVTEYVSEALVALDGGKGAVPPVACDTTTACTRRDGTLGGTAHISVNWSLPALVKVTV